MLLEQSTVAIERDHHRTLWIARTARSYVVDTSALAGRRRSRVVVRDGALKAAETAFGWHALDSATSRDDTCLATTTMIHGLPTHSATLSHPSGAVTR